MPSFGFTANVIADEFTLYKPPRNKVVCLFYFFCGLFSIYVVSNSAAICQLSPPKQSQTGDCAKCFYDLLPGQESKLYTAKTLTEAKLWSFQN